MKAVISLFFSVVVICVADDTYTTKFDNVDLDEIIKSDRLLNNYVDCLLDQGNCTPDGTELKKVLPEALSSECSKCSEKQKAGSKKIIKYLVENKRPIWNKLEEKYDVNGTYRKKYASAAKDENIKY